MICVFVSLVLTACTGTSATKTGALAEAARDVTLPAPQEKADVTPARVHSSFQVLSGRCEARFADLAGVNAVLASPTLTASVDKLGEGQVSLQYDLVNLHMMELNEQLANAECRLDASLDAAAKLRSLSQRGLAGHGLDARIAFIADTLQRVRRKLDNPRFSQSLSASQKGRIERHFARAQDLKSKLSGQSATTALLRLADFPRADDIVLELESAVLDRELLQRQAEQSRNIRLTLSGGYRYDNPEPDEAASGGGFGRATLQVRLGAFGAEWERANARKTHAALEELHAPERGALSRIAETVEANRQSIAALKDRERDMIRSLGKGAEDRNDLSEIDQLMMDLEQLVMRSELAEVQALLRILGKAQLQLGMSRG